MTQEKKKSDIYISGILTKEDMKNEIAPIFEVIRAKKFSKLMKGIKSKIF